MKDFTENLRLEIPADDGTDYIYGKRIADAVLLACLGLFLASSVLLIGKVV